MISITTTYINDRTDWYHAQARVLGVSYNSFMSTRLAALSDILRQLAVKGIVAF